jgi:hypothetical protein
LPHWEQSIQVLDAWCILCRIWIWFEEHECPSFWRTSYPIRANNRSEDLFCGYAWYEEKVCLSGAFGIRVHALCDKLDITLSMNHHYISDIWQECPALQNIWHCTFHGYTVVCAIHCVDLQWNIKSRPMSKLIWNFMKLETRPSYFALRPYIGLPFTRLPIVA